MKWVELIKQLASKGVIRHDTNHDLFIQPKNDNTEPVPRHSEVKEFMARKIFARNS